MHGGAGLPAEPGAAGASGASNAALPEPGATPPDRVLLLSVWGSGVLGSGVPGSGAVHWHARLIGPDAQVHEFDSPFELVRFLSQPPRLAGARRSGGLR